MALLAMTPGWLMVRDRATHPGMIAAALTASLTVTMLVTALIGIGTHALFGVSLPALSFAIVAIAASLFALAVTRNDKIAKPVFEWQEVVLGAIFLAYGFFVHFIAVKEGADGEMLIHGWYNADWFKHLGHVAAIANFGLPAADNFNQGDPLYYYWLNYVLPAAGVAIGNHGWAALATANSLLVMLFGSIFYGVLRHTGATRNIVLLIGVIALFASAPISFVYQIVAGIGIEGIMNFPAAPKGPGLMTLSQYIPQHLLAIMVLLGWFLLKDDRRLSFLALAALVPAMAISVLLGAVVLLAYGLYRLWSGRISAIPELAIMVIGSGLVVLVFQVVQIGNVDSAIESPLLTNEALDLPLAQRIFDSVNQVIGNVGLPFLISVFALYSWRPSEIQERRAKEFAIALIAAAILAAIAVEIVMTQRLAIETRIRVVNLPAIANAIIGVSLFHVFWHGDDARRRIIAVAVLVLLVLVALPSAAMRTAWHGKMGDSFTTTIPADDREVLRVLREGTPRTTIVLQYPEPPLLAPEPGHDAWASVLGQRAVTASLRATDYPLAQPRIEAAQRFFAGEAEPIAAEVDAVYLSRILHPESYDALVRRMEREAAFETLACYADACLFQRLDNSNP